MEQGTSGEGGEQGGKSILGLETIEDSLMKAWGQAGEISEVMEERGEVSPLTTSIVYTDEGGREQSLVGKVFYQTDETGQSTIFIQEVQHEVKKLVKLKLGDTEGYMIGGARTPREGQSVAGWPAKLTGELCWGVFGG